VRKAGLMETLLPKLQIEIPARKPVDPKSFFSFKPKAVWLEIGFGGGEHLVAQAAKHPEIGFLGCEPFVNGVASILDHIEREKIENIRIYNNDARHLLDAVPDGSIERCFVLFADPWPKSKHIERRFIGPENLPRLARVIKPGGELRLATDDARLGPWMLEHTNASKDFRKSEKPDHERPEDWIETRYEQKGIAAGRKPIYLSYQRL
jgi:tRNA (guanine-N7-)-methyltransferase